MNNHYKTLIAILSAAIGGQHWHDWIMSALAENGTPRSKSAVQGWGLSPDHKNFRRMTTDDLQDVLDAIYKRLNHDH